MKLMSNLTVHVQQRFPRMVAALHSRGDINCVVPQAQMLFVLGLPAVGKGTQCELLARNFGCYHISAGELLRKELATGSSVGKVIKSHMDRTLIIPSEITVSLLKKEIDDFNCGIVHLREYNSVFGNFDDKEQMRLVSLMRKLFPFLNVVLIDGFPRNISNLRGWREQFGTQPPLLRIESTNELITKRYLARKRHDDNPDVIAARIQSHIIETNPVIEEIGKSSEVLTLIDRDETIEAKHSKIVLMIERSIFFQAMLLERSNFIQAHCLHFLDEA